MHSVSFCEGIRPNSVDGIRSAAVLSTIAAEGTVAVDPHGSRVDCYGFVFHPGRIDSSIGATISTLLVFVGYRPHLVSFG